MKKNISGLFVLLIITISLMAQTDMKENITCKQAIKLMNKLRNDTNFVILDVRTPEEFENGHIEKALLINFKADDFKDRIGKLDKQKTYLVYCHRGGRSAKSIEIMRSLNFVNLYHLYEGMEIWKIKGYKIDGLNCHKN